MTTALVDADRRPSPAARRHRHRRPRRRPGEPGGPEAAGRRRRPADPGRAAAPAAARRPRRRLPPRRTGRRAATGPGPGVSAASPWRTGCCCSSRRPTRRPTSARRTAALHRLAAELATAANPHAIAFLVSTTAARLLEADACGVFSRTGVGALTALHSSGWPAATAGQFTRVELRRGRPLSDAVLDGTPVWLEDAEQWRRRYPEMAPVGTSSGFQATACLPLRVRGPGSGRRRVQLPDAPAVPRRRARVPAGGRRPVRPGARPRPAAGRRAGRARDRRAPARPDDVPRPGGPADGGAAVGRGAPAAARRPRRPGHRRLVRGAPGARGPGRRRWRSPTPTRPRSRSSPGCRSATRPTRTRPAGPSRSAAPVEPAFFPEIPDELLVDAAVDEEHLRLIRSIGLRSAVVVPLLVRGRSLAR